MTDKILNIKDIKYQPWQHGERFDAKLGAVSSRIGAQKLGHNITFLHKMMENQPLCAISYVIRLI